MTKIKNVKADYVKRAHLATVKPETTVKGGRPAASEKRSHDYMTAPIDESFYMDFRAGETKRS